MSWGVGFWARTRCERLSAPGAEIRLDDLLTGQMSVSQQTYDELGGFDVGFTRDGLFGGEDIDFGYRLLKAGKRVVFNPRAISYQYYDVDPAEYLRRARETGRSDWELVAKHPELAQRGCRLTRASPPAAAACCWSRSCACRRRSAGRCGPAPARWCAAASTPPACGASSSRSARSNTNAAGGRRGAAPPRARRSSSPTTRSPTSAAIQSSPSTGSPPRPSPPSSTCSPPAGTASSISTSCSPPSRVGLHCPRRRRWSPSTTPTPTSSRRRPQILSQRGIPAVVFAVSGQIGGSNEWDRHLGAPELPLLDAAGLRALTGAGIEIGSHTVNHPQLTKVPAATVEAELRDSAAHIEAAGLPRPRTFAYPHGEWSPAIAAAAQAAGYSAAFTIDCGAVQAGSDRNALPRIEVLASDTPRRLRLKLATARWPAPLRNRLWRAAGLRR